MAEPLRPQVPLPARMSYHRDGAVGAEGTGWSRKRSRDSSPSMTTARGGRGDSMVSEGPARARIGRAAPCRGGLRRGGRAANRLPNLSFFNVFVLKNGYFPTGILERDPPTTIPPTSAPAGSVHVRWEEKAPAPFCHPCPGSASKWKLFFIISCHYFYTEDFFFSVFQGVFVKEDITELNIHY